MHLVAGGHTDPAAGVTASAAVGSAVGVTASPALGSAVGVATPAVQAAPVSAGSASRGATASRPPSRRSSTSSARFQAAAPTTLRLRGPRRCTTPRTSSSQEWKTVWAHASWESSKKARSTRPVPSSRVVKTTRLPERMGGVWVAALAPATSTVSPCRASRSRRADTTPNSSRNSRWSSIRLRETSIDSTPSSALSRSAEDRSGSPAGSVRRPPANGSWPLPAPRPPRCSSVKCSCRSRRLAPKESNAPTWASRPASGRLGRARSQKSSSEAYGCPSAIRAASASLMPCTSQRASRIPHTFASPDPSSPLLDSDTSSIQWATADRFTSNGRIGTPAAARPPAAAASGTSRGRA